jgi:outer membrane immunogenic protein
VCCWRALFAIASATLALAGHGLADDLPVSATAPPPTIIPPYDWSGPYFGISAGGGFGTSRKDFTPAPRIAGPTTGDFSVGGALGGLFAGFNKQWGNFVVSLEADFSGTGIDGSTTCPNSRFTCETNTGWLATVRPRLGYAFGNSMAFVTGGLAAAEVNVKSFVTRTGVRGVNYSPTSLGWTAGAGFERTIYPNWSVRVEYLYVQFEDTDVPSDVGTPTATKLNENLFRAGLSYSFK